MRYLARHTAKRHARAFTLVEAIVTLVLVLILAAMLIPQFSGESASAADIQAHASAQAALSAAATIYQTTGVLPNYSALQAQYPDVSFVNSTTSSVSPSTVSVGVNTAASVFAAAVPGGNSTCWMTSWSTNDSSPTLPPTLYAMESTTVSGFNCSAQYALSLSTCQSGAGATGDSWSTPLVCDFTNVSTTSSTSTTVPSSTTTVLENLTTPQVSVTSNVYSSSGGSMTWSWTATSGGVGTISYFWSISPSSGGSCSSGVTTSTSFSCNGTLTAGQSYTFSVYAQDANGYSSPVSSVSAVAATAPVSSTTQSSGSTTTTTYPPLSAPVLSLASNTYGTNGDSMSWSWTPSTGGTGTITYHWQNSPWTSTCSLGSTTSLGAACSGGLTPGAVYTFSLYAQDSNGTDSSVVSITTVAATAATTTTSGSGTTTTAVTITTPTPTVTLDTTTPGGAGTMSWSWPASTGSTGTIGYYWALSPQTSTCSVGSTTTTSFSCSNSMIPGTAYTLSVYAQDSMGNTSGVGTVTATQVAPATVPDAPTGVNGTSASNASSTVSWQPPVYDGGYPITSYSIRYSSDGGSTWTTATSTASSSPVTVAGLINGTPYVFEVAAANSVGLGPYSTMSSPATPSTVPGAPTGVSAIGGVNSATTVSWAAPINNGGAIITKYTVTGLPSGSCVSTGPTQCTVTGLTNGTSYTFTVTATNASGTGPASSASSPITPTTTVPGAPTGATAVARYQSANVSWAAPSDNGGTPITLYTATSSPGALTCTSTSSTSCTVLGLTDGTSYTFTITATNSVGTGSPSQPSNAVTPTTTVPDQPTGLTATPGNAQATLNYTAPSYYGGSAITSYVAQYSSDGGTTWVTASTSPSTCSSTSCTVVGLTNGTAYEFEVAAVNQVGQGAWSSPSPTVTPITAPGAPTNVSATLASQSTQVSWTAPVSNGGATITLYTVTGSPSGSCTTSTTSCTITGLTNGTSYSFTVTATNAAGTGPASAPATVTPAAVPSAPQDVTAIPGNSQATISWLAPATDNGAAITSYTVTATPGGATCTTAGSLSCIVTGLTNGSAYSFSVTATNAAGTSAPSLSFNPSLLAMSPQIWLPLSDAAGSSTATDATGNGYSSSVSSGVTFGQPGPIQSTPSDTAALFNGTSGSISTNYSNTNTSYTSTFWYQTTTNYNTTAAEVLYAGTPTGSSHNGFEIGMWNGNVTAIEGTGSNWYQLLSPVNSDGHWHQVVLTYDGATMSLYQDGALVGTRAVSGGTAGLVNMVVGTGNSRGWYAGSLADVTVFSTPLTATQVGELYAASSVTPLTTPTAPTGVNALSYQDGASTVSWSAPSSNGGSAITQYTVAGSPGGSCVTYTTTCNVTGLTNGTSYTFTVTATNAAGTSSSSGASSPITPATVPTAPGAPAATGAQNSTSTLTWTAPASNGGASVTSYIVRYTTNGGTTWSAATTSPSTCTTTSCTVISISNGTSYEFEVAAINPAGTSSWSLASSPIVPSTVPGAPAAVTASLGDTVSQVSWTPPASNGGATITLYTVTSSPSGLTCTSTSSTNCTVSGLTDGTTYTFTVTATNVSGTGPASTPSNAVTPAPVPSAPLSPSATPGNAQATVSWSAPASSGGSSISAYNVTSSPGGLTCATTGALTCTVTGLTNGTAYTFTVTATNATGTGPASVATSPVTPFTTPGTPTGVVAQSYTDSQSLVTWSAPSSNGGSSITDYAVEYSPSPYTTWTVATTTATVLHYTVTGLTNGTSYEFQVAAINAAGAGAYSSPSLPATPATVASAPTSVTGTSYVDSSVPLSWAAPTSNGGTPITSYVIEYSLSPYSSWALATTSPASCSSTSCTVTGLTNGTGYEFQVAAVNNAGTGPYSTPSSPVTPSTTASAPTSLACSSAASTQSSITWSAPASNGGAAISGYEVQYSSDGGSTWTTASSSAQSPYTLTGLTNGTTYDCQVAAVNPSGVGVFSSPVAFTPSAPPTAPTNFTATPGNTQVTLYWAAPTSNGGATISSYNVTSSPGTQTCSTTGATSCVVTGLTNGTSYTFTVTATNVSGTSPGATVTATPATVPGAPTAVTATSGNAQATLSWTAPANNGGSAVTSYTITYANSPYSTWYSAITSPATCTTTSCTVTTLTNGSTYEFEVTAVNVMGAGPASSASNAVLVAAPPTAPTGVTASPGNAQATVTWTGSSSTGGTGLTITAYNVTGYNTTTSTSQGSCSTGGATSCVVSGLTNGDSYTFTVTATNSASLTSAPSSSSAPVTPSTVPGAPTSLSTSTGNGTITVSFSPPVSNGGSAITGYAVTSPGTSGCTTTGPNGSSCTVTGLAGGTSYTFTVTASNINGAGPGATITATAISTPSAPQSFTVSPNGAGSVSASWTAPSSNGGATITSYYAYANGTSSSCTTSGTSCSMSGLANGSTYTFYVYATNSVGNGASASTSATTYSAPATPYLSSSSPSTSSITFTFANTSNGGGSSQTWYLSGTCSGSGSDSGSNSFSVTCSGLASGTTYSESAYTISQFGVVSGTGSGSATTTVTPPSTPSVSVSGYSAGYVYFAFSSSSGGGTITYSLSGCTSGSASGTAGVGQSVSCGNGTTSQGQSETLYVSASNAGGSSGTGSATGTASYAPPTGSGAAYAIGLNTAEVSWSSPSYGITQVALYTSKSSSCSPLVHSASSSYTQSNNTQNGYVTSSGSSFYSPAAAYYGYIIITNPAGTYQGGCFYLGTS